MSWRIGWDEGYGRILVSGGLWETEGESGDGRPRVPTEGRSGVTDE